MVSGFVWYGGIVVLGCVGFVWIGLLGWLGVLVAESLVGCVDRVVEVDVGKDMAPDGAGRRFGLLYYLFHKLPWLDNRTVQVVAAGFGREHLLDCNSRILRLESPNLRV
jgi:hypothetical protein